MEAVDNKKKKQYKYFIWILVNFATNKFVALDDCF